MAYYYGNELYHHGILGMKWGRRNGPPYPLNGSDHSASEKKAGWRKSLDGGSNIAVKRKKKKEKDEVDKGSGSNKKDFGEAKVYREVDNNKAKHEEKKRDVAYESGGNESRKKSVSEMSDKELQQAINRARLENKYADFAGEAVSKKSNTKDALEKTRGIKKQVNNFLPAKDDKFKKEPVPDSKYPWDKSKSQEENKRLQTEYHENRKRIEQANKDGQAAFDAKKQNIKIGNNAVDLGLSTIESASKLSKAKNDRKVEKIKEKAKEQAQEMDYKDLEATVKRLDMERQYNELINSKTTSTGREKAMQALEVTGAVLAVAVPAYQLYKEIKKSSSNKGGGS